MKLFLCGDVMTGRGIDQILAHPCNPVIHEPYARSALEYVELAEAVNGQIPRAVAADYIWGDALPVLGQATVEFQLTGRPLPAGEGSRSSIARASNAQRASALASQR